MTALGEFNVSSNLGDQLCPRSLRVQALDDFRSEIVQPNPRRSADGSERYRLRCEQRRDDGVDSDKTRKGLAVHRPVAPCRP